MYSIIHLILALLWATMTGAFTLGNVCIGLFIGWAILYAAQPVLGASAYLRRIRASISLIGFVLFELVVANARVAAAVILPGRYLRPGVVAVPLEARTDLEIALLSNTITLTPGTFTLELSEGRDVLYVHALNLDSAEALIEEIKSNYERRVLEVLRD